LRRRCEREGLEYEERRGYRGKYPAETRRLIYELHQQQLTFTEIASQLTETGVPHPDGETWKMSMVRAVYASECAIRGEKTVGRRAQLPAPMRKMLVAKHNAGMTYRQLADELNRTNVPRYTGGEWTAQHVGSLVYYERWRTETGPERSKRAISEAQEQEMARRKADGHKLREIADWANREGIRRQRTNRPWDANAVHNVLRRLREDDSPESPH